MAADLAEQLIGDFARFMTCDVDQLSPDGAAQLVLAAEIIDRSFQAKRRQVLALFDRLAGWQADGATSAANRLAARTGRRRAVLRREVQLACSVAAAPAVAAVAARLSNEHLQLLASCRSDRTLEAYERDKSRRRCPPGASFPHAGWLVGPVRPPPARRR